MPPTHTQDLEQRLMHERGERVKLEREYLQVQQMVKVVFNSCAA